jgi:hypothetical protein
MSAPLSMRGGLMHAVLVTFESDAPLDQLEIAFECYAIRLATTKGLLMKTWISDDVIVGGFHLFEDRCSADAYLNGDLFEAFLTDPTLAHFRVQRFDVCDRLSALTHCHGNAPVSKPDDHDAGDAAAKPLAGWHAPRQRCLPRGNSARWHDRDPILPDSVRELDVELAARS